MKLNINECLKVKLTTAGINELSRQREEFIRAFPHIKLGDLIKNTDSDGYTKFQLHDLMNKFGHMMSVGSELPFHANILIGDDK